MSKSFIHYTSADWIEMGYDNETEAMVKDVFPDSIYFNLDAKSDLNLVNLGGRLISESRQLILFLELEEEIQPTGATKLLNQISRQKELDYQIIYSGENEFLHKMLITLKGRKIQDKSALADTLNKIIIGL